MAKKDFEARYFDQIDAGFTRIESGVDDVKQHLATLNGQTARNSTDIKRIKEILKLDVPKNVNQLPKPWQDPTLIKIFLILLIVIAAGVFGVNISGVHFP